jgi:hypothetical protein
LLHIRVLVVQNDVGPALKAVFRRGLNLGQLFFGALGYEFGQFLAVIVIINIEILGLVILPFECPELNPVFPEFHRIDLGPGKKAAGKEKAGN